MATPLMYRDFGTDMVTIDVSEAPEKKQFHVHKNLICRESTFFRSSFERAFIEISRRHLKLPEDYPDVFEAFCDWLYSRQIRDPIVYTANHIPDDLFWLRVYIMAVRQNNAPLQLLASEKITSFGQPESVPSAPFVAELFETPPPSKYLERYVVRHVAKRLAGQHTDWKIWTRSLKANERFGAEIVIRVAKLSSANYKKCKLSPEDDARFVGESFDNVETEFEDDHKDQHKGRRPFLIHLHPSFANAAACEVKLTATMTVEQLRKIISIQMGIPSADIVLTCMRYSSLAYVLCSGRALHEYDIKKNTRVRVGWVGKQNFAKLRNNA